jgi:putative nucleotidyltransferase with HDIG domain
LVDERLASRAWVGTADGGSGTLRTVAHAGFPSGPRYEVIANRAQGELEGSPTAAAFFDGLPAVARLATGGLRHGNRVNHHNRKPSRAVAAVPIKVGGRVEGVLTVHSQNEDAFDDELMALLGHIAEDIGRAMHVLSDSAIVRRPEGATSRARSAHRVLGAVTGLSASDELLWKVVEGTAEAMAMAVELRDPYTAGHQRRVVELAMAIANDMSLNAQQKMALRLAALVHDMGKMAIPAEILTKPCRLSAIEIEIVQTHPHAGYDILKRIDFPWPVAEIVLQHHERLDGSGYPASLRGEQICLEARILAVADVVEAIAAHRPYRPGLGIDVALEEIRSGRGSRYDAVVVDTCLALFSKKGFSFESDAGGPKTEVD